MSPLSPLSLSPWLRARAAGGGAFEVVRVAHAGVARHVLGAGGDPARARGRRRGEHALAGPEEGVGAGDLTVVAHVCTHSANAQLIQYYRVQ